MIRREERIRILSPPRLSQDFNMNKYQLIVDTIYDFELSTVPIVIYVEADSPNSAKAIATNSLETDDEIIKYDFFYIREVKNISKYPKFEIQKIEGYEHIRFLKNDNTWILRNSNKKNPIEATVDEHIEFYFADLNEFKDWHFKGKAPVRYSA